MLAEEAMFDSEAVANRERLLAFLRSDEPAWKDEDHPELAQGTYQWVRALRAEAPRDIGASTLPTSL